MSNVMQILTQFKIKHSKHSFLLIAKERLFSIIYLIFETPTIYPSIEKVSVIFQLLQILAYSFNINFITVWKQQSLFKSISFVIKYFQIIPFFENNIEIYLLAFYICCALILFFYGYIIYLCVSKIETESVMTTIIHSLLSLIVMPLYLPIMILFSSILSCHNRINIHVQSLQCWIGLHIMHSIFGIVMIILFAVLAYVFISLDLHEKNSFVLISKDSNIKITTSCSVNLLIGKTILILLYTVFNTMTEAFHWTIITFSLFISAFIYYDYYTKQPYIDQVFMKYIINSTAIILWSHICLAIGKILEPYSYNGSLLLFLIGIPSIIVFVYTMNNNKYSQLINKQKKSPIELIHCIFKLFFIFETKDKNRDSRIMFDGYVSLYEETCHIKLCPLKQFLYLRSKSSFEKISLLYQHIEILYSIGITQFPKSSALRISFASFLMTIMKMKNRAMTELLNAQQLSSSFEEYYTIYKHKDYIQNSEQLSSIDSNDEIKENMLYKKEFTLFKSLLRKVTLNYIDFLNILLSSNQDSNNEFEQLNRLGKSITKNNKKISNQFQHLQKLKYNDRDTIACYSDYLLNVINDKDKSNEYRASITNSKDDIAYEETFNLDTHSFSYSDESQYIIISSQPETFGMIMNISLGLCSVFGYSKSEIIGKKYDFIYPEIYAKPHKEMLFAKIQDIRKNCNNYYQFKEIFSEKENFIITKSKYLMPIEIIIGIIPNESNDFSIIAKILRSIDHKSDGHDCYVMTNNELIIQHFSPNAITYLGLNSKSINSTVEISDHIREFSEEFLNGFVKLEVATQEKLAIKLEIIKQKFNTETQITWKRFKRDSTDMLMCNLTITEQKLINKSIGFIFKLKYIKEVYNTNTNMASNKSLSIGREKNTNSLSKIEEKYIPELNTKFNLDPMTMSFKLSHVMNSQISKGGQVTKNLEYIRNLALNKIKLEGETISNSLSRQDSSSSYYSSSYSNSCEEKESIVSIEVAQKEKPIILKQNDDEYYQIDYSHIKLLLYDYTKKGVIEEDYNKVSQVELKKNENGKDNETSTESTQSALKQKAKTLQIKQDIIMSDQLKEGINANQIVLTNQTEIIIKQIETSLSIKESQPSILQFIQFSLIVLVLLLGIGVFFIGFLITSFKNIKESSLTIQNSYDIIFNLIYSHYHVREASLLNNPNYTSSYYKNKQEAWSTIQKTLLDLYNSTNLKMNQIITTIMPMREEVKYLLNNKTIPLFLIQNNSEFSLKSFELTIKSAIIETNTALFHVTTFDLDELIPLHKDLHFFIRNGMNWVLNAISDISNKLIDELQNNLTKAQYLFIIPFVLLPFVLTFSFFLLRYGYKEVMKRKESYLEIFFEISKSEIQKALIGCEFFNKIIQNESINDSLSTEDEYDIDKSDFNRNDANSRNRLSQSKNKMSQLSKELALFLKKILIILVIIFMFFVFVFAFLWDYFNSFAVLFEIYQYNCEYEMNNSCSLNYLREFLFDMNNDNLFCNSPLDSESVQKVLLSLLTIMKEKEIQITTNINYYPKSFQELYAKINKENICGYATDYFFNVGNEMTCEEFLYGSATLGMTTLLTSYIEEMRFIRNIHNIYQKHRDKQQFEYNLTLVGTKYYDELWPDNILEHQLYNELHPILTFNHFNNKNLAIIFLNFLYPAYTEINDYMKTDINNSINNYRILYLSIFFSYLGIVLLFFVFIFIPFMNKMNQSVSLLVLISYNACRYTKQKTCFR